MQHFPLLLLKQTAVAEQEEQDGNECLIVLMPIFADFYSRKISNHRFMTSVMTKINLEIKACTIIICGKIKHFYSLLQSTAGYHKWIILSSFVAEQSLKLVLLSYLVDLMTN